MKKALIYSTILIITALFSQAHAALKVTPTMLELNANETRGNYLTASFDVQGDKNETIRFKIYPSYFKITHKNKVYDAQHTPLVSEELFNDAQNLLQLNAVARKHSTNAKTGTLLAGLLLDDKGNKMCPSYSKSSNKLYRYYISPALKDPSKYERGEITKISAGEIEQYVRDN